FVVVGSPKTVREQLIDGIKRLRIGHLLALLHFGSMPTALCKKNIDLFAREVLPHLAELWDDTYEDRWWPERLKAKRPAAALAAASKKLAGEWTWPPRRYAGSAFGRIESKPRSRSAAAVSRSSTCTGRGGLPPTAHSLPALPTAIRSMRR